ncbi:MAG: DUF1007 family protein [Pseudomonadota bacterium]
MRGAAAALALSLACAPAAQAHPHVFIDSGLHPVFDEAGYLTGLDFHWWYDPNATVALLDAMALDLDQNWELTREEEERLTAELMNWQPDFNGFTVVEGVDNALSRPVRGQATLEADQMIHIRFTRTFDQKIRPEFLDVLVYDGEFYIAFALIEALNGDKVPKGCTAEIVPYDQTEEADLAAATLWDLDPYATPEDPNIGVLFADRLRVMCGPKLAG